jgi:hypothetical protein
MDKPSKVITPEWDAVSAFTFHLAAAADFEISFLFSGLRDSALAFPPFDRPLIFWGFM